MQDVPTIALGFYNIHNDIDAVIVDDYYNANQIANALIELGYGTVGFLGDAERAHSSMDRYYGYEKALRENRLERRAEWIISDLDKHGRCITDYQLPDDLPQAFMCHSDFASYHLMLKLKKRKLRVPDDVAIATFDNTDKTKSSGCVIGLNVTGVKFAEAGLRQMLWRHRNPEHEHRRVIINAPLARH